MASNPRIDDLRKRLEREPGSRLFAQLAEELRKAGDLEEAIGLSLEGLQKHPSYPSARMTLGRCLLDKGDLMGARREFEAVLKGAPDNILACRFLAECLEGLGDLEGAVAQHRACLRLSPGDPLTMERLAAVEARIASGPAPSPAPATGGVGAGGPEDVDAEPPPIPLAAVDEDAFELERSYEAPATVVGGSPEPEEMIVAGPVDWPGAEPGPSAEPERADSQPEPPGEREAVLDIPGLEVSPDVQPTHHAAEVSPLPVEKMPVPAFRKFEGEPPPPWVAPAPTAPPEAAPPTEIASSTLAELYLNQGFAEKAIEVYREVTAREPGNARARTRLAELEGAGAAASDARPAAAPPGPAQADPADQRRQGLQRAITGLEKVLAAVRKE